METRNPDTDSSGNGWKKPSINFQRLAIGTGMTLLLYILGSVVSWKTHLGHLDFLPPLIGVALGFIIASKLMTNRTVYISKCRQSQMAARFWNDIILTFCLVWVLIGVYEGISRRVVWNAGGYDWKNHIMRTHILAIAAAVGCVGEKLYHYNPRNSRCSHCSYKLLECHKVCPACGHPRRAASVK
jgi:hypothetical protein